MTHGHRGTHGHLEPWHPGSARLRNPSHPVPLRRKRQLWFAGFEQGKAVWVRVPLPPSIGGKGTLTPSDGSGAGAAGGAGGAGGAGREARAGRSRERGGRGGRVAGGCGSGLAGEAVVEVG